MILSNRLLLENCGIFVTVFYSFCYFFISWWQETWGMVTIIWVRIIVCVRDLCEYEYQTSLLALAICFSVLYVHKPAIIVTSHFYTILPLVYFWYFSFIIVFFIQTDLPVKGPMFHIQIQNPCFFVWSLPYRFNCLRSIQLDFVHFWW